MKQRRLWLIIMAIVLVVVLAASLIYIFVYKKGKITPQATGENVMMYLNPSTGAYQVGDNFTATIKVNTDGALTDNVFAAVLFDATALTVTSLESTGTYSQEILNNISDGKLIFNAGVDLSIPDPILISGDVSVATISFTALKAANPTAVTFLVEAGNTDTSTVSYQSTNILNSVANANYIINSPVVPAPTVDLKINGQDGTINKNSGESATLAWSSANATICSATGSWSGAKAMAGSESTGALSSSSTYNLTCSGDGGSASDSVSVSINNITPPPPTTTTTTPNPSNKKTTTTPKTSTTQTTTTPSLLTPTTPNRIAFIPANVTPKVNPTAQKNSSALFANISMQPWTLWFLYAIIPAFLAGALIYFYLKRKNTRRAPLA